ncbi:mechanosensitive ion channel family protein [Photobacterium lutimaris]|uniref:Mechanosensitive ion channel n=1 Tax=Photobacterium lutimaris TaxID=388278 RepID=A0A2T3J0L6_9GAMM|nr:mechanosensitive ion channel domain-containing protein [Photobacterium lutimaris]PSU34621.1 mechanosensitive ion channel [Photobacterium lutimaris]TDR71534.1 MscS family membrane protein [Photobacterium lutimaris]
MNSRLITQRLLLISMMFFSVSPFAHTPFSLADTSSPKTTLVDFLYFSEIVIKHWQEEKLDTKEAKHAYNQAVRAMDLSLVHNRSRTVVLMERIILLREILDRFDTEVLQAAPDYDQAKEMSYWRFANSDLSIVRLESGSRQGQFVFSANTIQQIHSWYRNMESLPYASESRIDYYQDFLIGPGPLFSKGFIYSLPVDLLQLYGSLPLWQWLALLSIFVVCKLLIKLSFKLGELWNSHWETKGQRWQVGRLLSLLSAVLILLATRRVIDNGIWITGSVYQLLSTAFLLWQFFFASWLILALFNYLATIYAYHKHNGKEVDSSLITVLARIFGGLTIAILAIYIVEFMGFSISPIVAGLGVGGLAVALAIRPVLENVINGLTLYADGGIKIGELCRYGDKLGTIESIGLRSTRIRTLERSLITIPNSEFANMEIDNLERRDKRRMEHTFRVRSELTRDQLRLLLVNIRRVLLRHPQLEEEPLRARFMGVGEYGILVNVLAYIRCRDHDEFMAVQEDVLLMVMRQIEIVGAQLAFSNQYQFAGKLSAVDEALKEKASNTVKQWHDTNNYPFPDFSFEYKYEIKDTIIYPVTTSAIRKNATA